MFVILLHFKNNLGEVQVEENVSETKVSQNNARGRWPELVKTASRHFRRLIAIYVIYPGG